MVVPYDGLDGNIPKGYSQFLCFLLDCFGLGMHSVEKLMKSCHLSFNLPEGGARKRSDRADNTCHLQDEKTDCEEECKRSLLPYHGSQILCKLHSCSGRPLQKGEDIIRSANAEKHTNPRRDGLNGWTTSWIVNTKERIVKSTLTFVAKFWWAVVRLRLFPTGGDNTSVEDKAVLVASLVLVFPLNMEEIITQDMNFRAVKLSTSFPFPCLITRLCREAHVPIFAGIDVEIYATKNYDLEKSKDEPIYELKLHEPIPEVFEPIGQNARATKASTKPAKEAIGGELVCRASPIHTFIPSTSDAAMTQPERQSAETSSSMPRPSPYAFTPANFSRVVRKADIQDKQLKLFAEQLGPFVNRVITDSLEPYEHLHARMDDMEVRVNDRLKDLTVLELSRVVAELKKAQNNILKLQQERQTPEFSLVEFEESKDDPKAIGKWTRDDFRDEGKSHKKKKHKRSKQEKAELKEALKQSRMEAQICIKEMRPRVGGASSSSASPVERHITGVIVHSELTTLATPSPATDATPHDPLSVIPSIEATTDGSRVTPPQTIVPDSGV
ncbi:hypothetical protein HAX54_021706 [Datura stramonium]|uniref:Putative plant transposon protein domain-containing protein n=1 Tax=Datura stramonium TaxID=4076 RepID=A0ABS8UW41_DATST|nr:hypothetical protein [Datura stramonium]